MSELLRGKLNEYIPTILGCLEESIIDEAYNTGLKRFQLMQSAKPDEKISAPSFIEYIIHADYTNCEVQLCYIKEIDASFKILKDDHPQFIDKFRQTAGRLIRAVNSDDIFDNMLDWENIAVELLVFTKLWKKDIEIKDIEYELDNNKSIDAYLNHNEFGELLCEFRSIHIDLNSGKSNSKIRKRVKDIIRQKVKAKTKKLDKKTLPAVLSFLFIIQVHNGAELTQELLKGLNTIYRKDGVLPIMVCRIGRTIDDNKPLFEIVQIQHLIKEE